MGPPLRDYSGYKKTGTDLFIANELVVKNKSVPVFAFLKPRIASVQQEPADPSAIMTLWRKWGFDG